jgi:hypothetical protein
VEERRDVGVDLDRKIDQDAGVVDVDESPGADVDRDARRAERESEVEVELEPRVAGDGADAYAGDASAGGEAEEIEAAADRGDDVRSGSQVDDAGVVAVQESIDEAAVMMFGARPSMLAATRRRW